MSFRWKLKESLAIHHQMYQLADIRRVIEERTGVRWSLETVSQLVNKTPKSLRVQTVQTLCDAFSCRLDDICEILPDARPGFAKLLDPSEHDTSVPELGADYKTQESGRGRGGKRPRAVGQQVDLGSLFPEARQFRDGS
jgi:DNA-binding Xre family transcriptional regulator